MGSTEAQNKHFSINGGTQRWKKSVHYKQQIMNSNRELAISTEIIFATLLDTIGNISNTERTVDETMIRIYERHSQYFLGMNFDIMSGNIDFNNIED